MKKNITIILLLLFLLSFEAVIAEDVALECSNMAATIQLKAPSANARCFTVMNSVSAPADKPLSEARLSSAAISLDDYTVAGKIAAEATAFTINGLSSVNTEIYKNATDLTTMINAVNSGSGTSAVNFPVPFLPIQDKTQLFAALPEIIQFSTGTAVRYLTAFGDSGASVDNSSLIYAVQGISQDGKFYLSLAIPISHPQLTTAINPAGFDWNTLPVEGWTPAIAALDTLARSIILR